MGTAGLNLVPSWPIPRFQPRFGLRGASKISLEMARPLIADGWQDPVRLRYAGPLPTEGFPERVYVRPRSNRQVDRQKALSMMRPHLGHLPALAPPQLGRGALEGKMPLGAKGCPWRIAGEDVYPIAEHDKPSS